MFMNRKQLAQLIIQKLEDNRESLAKEFAMSDQISSCVIDNLLDEQIVQFIYEAFPQKEEMSQRNSIRELKYVAAQMNLYNPLLEEIIYAFQDPKFLSLLSEITGIPQLLPDEYLYAGGISLMDRGCFLNPHIDNSHDKDRKNYRVLNLLYYVTPDWQEGYGGNLELWDNGLKSPQRTIWSKFNRLVIMKTDKSSYHSVNPVIYNGSRCCVSNYYFSPVSPESEDYFHVTSFRGRPEQKLRDLVLKADIAIRNKLRKVFPQGIVKPWHIYKK